MKEFNFIHKHVIQNHFFFQNDQGKGAHNIFYLWLFFFFAWFSNSCQLSRLAIHKKQKSWWFFFFNSFNRKDKTLFCFWQKFLISFSPYSITILSLLRKVHFITFSKTTQRKIRDINFYHTSLLFWKEELISSHYLCSFGLSF